MPTRTLKKLFKVITSSRQRLLILTVILTVLLLASIGAIVAHQALTSITTHSETKYNNIPLLTQQGQLIVGVDPQQPPFSFMDNDQLAGYNIDLAHAIGLEIGLPVSFKTINAANLNQQADPQSQLNQGQIHLIIANTPITSSRQQYFNVSQPYLSVSQVGISLKGRPFIDSQDQLQGKVIATIDDSITSEYAQTLTASTKHLSFPDTDHLVASLTNRQAEVALIDLPTANRLIAGNNQLTVVTHSLIEEPYAILTAKQQWQLANLINSSLASLQQKAVIQSLQQKWLRQP